MSASDAPARPAWRDVLARRALWSALARQALPVAGVLFLGWPVLDVALFFLLETWLFLTLRAGVELTLDPRNARWGESRGRQARRLAGNLLGAAVLLGLVIGVAGWAQVAVAFPRAEWQAFADGGWHEPTFLAALGLLVASHVIDAVRFARRIAVRSESEREADDRGFRAMCARVVLVALAGIGLGLLSAVGLGAPALVIMIAAIVVWLEAAPEQAERLLDFGPAASRP